MIREIAVQTRAREEMVDVSEPVAGVVAESGVAEGLAFVYCPHTTAAVTINESADPAVRRDILAWAGRAVPRDADWRHDEGNSDAHVKVVLVGPCQPIPITGGRLTLGTWQGIFLCEFDGPRSRRLLVKVVEA